MTSVDEVKDRKRVLAALSKEATTSESLSICHHTGCNVAINVPSSLKNTMRGDALDAVFTVCYACHQLFCKEHTKVKRAGRPDNAGFVSLRKFCHACFQRNACATCGQELSAQHITVSAPAAVAASPDTTDDEEEEESDEGTIGSGVGSDPEDPPVQAETKKRVQAEDVKQPPPLRRRNAEYKAPITAACNLFGL